MSTRGEVWLIVLIWVVLLVISAFNPADRLTWFLEVLPVMVAAPLLLMTYNAFPLSRILLWMIFLHGPILIMGGYYTYAEVPFGFYLQDVFDFARNPYDRIGHFAQGFVPALLTREILLRKTPLQAGKMMFLLAVSVPLAFSAFYELIEWRAALILDQNATAFLGTQGDPWDTQSDMFMAMIGAITALVLFAKLQDRQLARIREGQE